MSSFSPIGVLPNPSSPTPAPTTSGTTYALTNYTSIPAPPTACIYAELRYGSNGSTSGVAEILLGHSGSDASTTRITWDEASSGSFDSGQVPFELTIQPGGGSANQDSLNVEGALSDPINYSLTTYGAMSDVVVEAGVQINAAVTVTSLSVEFYKAGVVTDTFFVSSGPSVNTTSASNPTAAQVLTITPSHTDNDMVRVFGTIELQAPAGTYPGADDLFVQVFIQTASCSQ